MKIYKKINKIIADSLRVGDVIRRKMKRLIALLILIALLATMIVGCRGDNGDDPSTENGGEGTENENNNNGENNTQEQEKEEPELVLVDFINDDLSLYIEIDERYYKELTLTLDPDRLNPVLVENKIIQLLCKNKSKEAVDGDGVISVGDVVDIYYKGYYLDGKNSKVYFNGGSNMGGNAYSLEIGSGGFIPGFEYNMIGKAVSDYSIDNPMVIETYFPKAYQSQELAGKTAYFEVYVPLEGESYRIKEYDAPEFNDEFITGTLGIAAGDLESYEGDTLADRYRASLREQLIVENGLDKETMAEELFWSSVLEGAVIKEYPAGNIKSFCDEFKEELTAYYNSNPYYAIYYPTLDIFACAYFGLEEGSDWQAQVRTVAENTIKEQLIFYYIATKEGFIPTEEEYRAEFDRYLIDTLAANGIKRENFDTEEKYLEAIESYRQQLIKNNGEEAIREMINYNLTIKSILALITVIEG